MDMQISDFIKLLSSKAPVPGGGGASALIGAIGVSLCSMVANLTLGKKKYADYQHDLEQILIRAKTSTDQLLLLIEKDAAVFEPLSVAYGIPKDDPERDRILECALLTASRVPMEILDEIIKVLDIVEQLSVKGTRLAISDVGVAASACKCGMESAVLNVYINTKLMKNREVALALNAKAESLLADGISRCSTIYQQITEELR